MSRRIDKNIEAEIVSLYNTKTKNGWIGSSYIAKEFGISPETVRNILVRNNIKIRSDSEAHAGKACKPVKNNPVGDPPFCKCGCGHIVIWNQRKNKWNVYFEDHRRPPHLYKNIDWLRSAYEGGRTIVDIAKQFGTFPSTVYKFFRKFGLKARPHGETLKMLGNMKGDKNPSWKGGVTPERQRIYKTSEWIQLVKFIYERDNYTCKRCGDGHTRQNKLHAHHLHSWAEYPDMRLQASNLITLCDTCHRWVHSNKNINKDFIL